MFGQFLVADRDHPDRVGELAAAIRGWEPLLDLEFLPRHARVFEPDGTLYAVSLADDHLVTVDHRDRPVGRGDLIVVPQARALDVEPEVRFLGIRYEGPAPDHFRERFIQVWGFEHLPAPAAGPRGTRRLDVIPITDVRHRLVYAVWDVPFATPDAFSTGMDVALLVGLEGGVAIAVDGIAGTFDITEGTVAAVGPGLAYRVDGEGRVGRFLLMSEVLRQARRLEHLRATGSRASPEFAP
jgi:hypothetical protein